ncbi:MAG: hypothetical protein Q9162_004616 [Coniocarpon cinnabarinum]
MRWYTTSELCTILSRFRAIHLVGDSMMRHLAQSLNILLREDLSTGARATWRPGNPKNLDCQCHTLFDEHDCAREGFAAIGTEMVYMNDAGSMKCPQSTTAVIDFLPSVKDPPKEGELAEFKKGVKNGGEREVFVFGQGGWDDFEVEPAQRWISAFEGAMGEVVEGFERPPPPPPSPKEEEEKNKKDDASKPAPETKDATGPILKSRDDSIPDSSVDASIKTRAPRSLAVNDPPPRLWISPNAQGLHKNPFFVLGQNNIKLMTFEREMRAWLSWRGFDVLGMFNLTVQSESLDGTHANMESNLVKAMMVVNWLDWVGREDGLGS